MAKILVDIREVVGSQESGNNYAFQASAIVMSDNTTTVQDKLTTLTGYFNSSGYANNAVKLSLSIRQEFLVFLYTGNNEKSRQRR